MIPTSRTYLLLLLGGAIATVVSTIASTDTRSPLVAAILILWNLTLFFLVWWDSRQIKPVNIVRHPLSRLSIGRDNPVTITVGGRSGDRVQIRDGFPSDFQASHSQLEAFLTSDASQELVYTVKPLMRGEYNWRDLQIRQMGRWHLAWRFWKIPSQATVEVYPDLLLLRSLSIKLALQSTGTMESRRRLGIGTEFSELREYTAGDDLRLVDWKATARRSRPMVRVLEPEHEQTLIILLDRGRLMTGRIQGMTRFDFGMNAALGLALAGISRGDRVGIGVFDRKMHTWMPPARGQQQMAKFIERLTPIQPELLEPDYVNAVTTVVQQQIRRALVVIITDIVDTVASAELLLALARLRPRYLPFCVTLRDPDIDRLAHSAFPVSEPPNQAIASSYSRAVALDLIAQREVAFASLKQKGVLVLDAPANQVSEELVNRYLMLKLKNQL
jgi:uncharacterized protein (DUF58 family)